MNDQTDPYPTSGDPSGAPQSKGLAIAAMVLGIVSIPTFCYPYVSIPCAIIAIVLGFVARSKANRGEAGGAGFAVAGLLCGFVSIGLLVLLAVIFGVAFMGAAGEGGFFDQLRQEMDEQSEQMRKDMEEEPDNMDQSMNMLLDTDRLIGRDYRVMIS